MRFSNILFVQANYDSTFSNVLPAGIGYLSEFLSLNKVENSVFDLNVTKNSEEKLHEEISRCNPDIIGLSIMSLNYLHNYNVFRRVKEKFPQIKVVAGGAHISTMRNNVLEECEAIDYGIVLEGELTLLELMKGEKQLHEIEGLIYRIGEDVTYNGDRPFMKELDVLPFPSYSKFNKGDYSSLISIFTSRGCPYDCTYCPVQLAIGRRFFVRSPKIVVDEIEYHYKQGYREFSFRDDCLTLIPKRVYEICDEIERRNFKDLHLMCDNGIRADRVDFELLKRMKEVGFKMLAFGVESGDDRILKLLRKKTKVKDMEKAISIACELGYMVELFLLIGVPEETWDDFERTIKLATKYPVMAASFYHILPYPNTEMFQIAEENGYLLRRPEEYLNDGSQRRNTPFLSTPEFSYEQRKKAFDYAYKKTSASIKKTQKIFYKKNASEKLEKKGLPKGLAQFLATIYSIEFLHDHIFNNTFIVDLKKHLKKRSIKK
ncbi:MAG: cobalamin-dependent protein [Nitrospinae bacterium]|nr:cobalamin-dependent protein [Nitrospinota bacterium]